MTSSGGPGKEVTLAVGCYDHDDDLMDRARREGRPQLRVYRLERAVVVLGRGSRPAAELQVEHCLEDGVSVLRRPGGGCSVVIDLGNVIVSVALPLAGLAHNRRIIRAISEWLCEGVKRLGARDVSVRGVSDLVQHSPSEQSGERKVSGSCIYRPRGLLYYSATLLVEADLELIGRYLRHPPREPEHRGGRAHEAFLANLALPRARGVAQVEAGLRRELNLEQLGPTLLG